MSASKTMSSRNIPRTKPESWSGPKRARLVWRCMRRCAKTSKLGLDLGRNLGTYPCTYLPSFNGTKSCAATYLAKMTQSLVQLLGRQHLEHAAPIASCEGCSAPTWAEPQFGTNCHKAPRLEAATVAWLARFNFWPRPLCRSPPRLRCARGRSGWAQLRAVAAAGSAQPHHSECEQGCSGCRAAGMNASAASVE